MSAPNVDIVFVIDASDSMSPCFEQLCTHLQEVVRPMQNNISKLRFGLVAYSAGAKGGVAVYDHQFLCGSGPEVLKKLYRNGPNDPDPRGDFFTDDPGKFIAALKSVKPAGNEETLVALDTALDFPFGPLRNTKRVVALFSDETIESGVEEGANNSKLDDIITKIQARRILFFGALPESDGADTLFEVDASEYTPVDGGDGLGNVDFNDLLGQMGKSISVSTMQATSEPPYTPSIFGQDSWEENRIVTSSSRDVVLAVGESAKLNTSDPITNLHVRLNWTSAVDLDLHAFIDDGTYRAKHAYFGDMKIGDVVLDHDAGIGDTSGNNEENLNISSLDRIKQIVFATKIYSKGGRFSDYDGYVMFSTNNGDNITVPLSAQTRGDWCVIAKIDNRDPMQPQVINVTKVLPDEPKINDF